MVTYVVAASHGAGNVFHEASRGDGSVVMSYGDSCKFFAVSQTVDSYELSLQGLIIFSALIKTSIFTCPG